MPASEIPDRPGAPAPPTDAPANAHGAGEAVPARAPLPNIPRLPSDFYRGRRRARRAALLTVVVVLGSFAVLAEAHLVDLGALVGPHVARSEWDFAMTGVRDLNAMGLTGAGVTVCIVDSGIDMLHPDFARLRLVAWKDFVNLRPEPYDDNGHGTAMAGLIAANGSLRGIAPDASLLVAKATNSAGFGSSQAAADGIRLSVDPFGNCTRGAAIISITLGSKAPLFVATDVSLAAQAALDRGVFVVAAAGNDGGPFDDGDVAIPANVPMALAIGAVDSSGRIASFSSIGSSVHRTDPNLKPEVAAPGVQIISTAPGAHYVTVSGTSPATAVATGIVALLLQRHPELRPGALAGNVLALKWALARSAITEPGQAVPHDPWYGYGVIDGPRALTDL